MKCVEDGSHIEAIIMVQLQCAHSTTGSVQTETVMAVMTSGRIFTSQTR